MFNKKIFIFLLINFVLFQLHAVHPDPYVETTAIISAGFAATNLVWIGECWLNSQYNDYSSYCAGAVMATIVSLASLYRCAHPYRNSPLPGLPLPSQATTMDLCKRSARALVCGLSSVRRGL